MNTISRTPSEEKGRKAQTFEDMRMKLRAVFDVPSFIRDASTLFGIEIKPSEVVESYLEDPRLRAISPNPVFDELYYRRNYKDVSKAIEAGVFESGLIHFLTTGFEEGRFPALSYEMLAAKQSLWSDKLEKNDVAAELIANNPACLKFSKWFRFLSSVEIYNNLGRKIILPAGMKGGRFELLAEPEFDADFYLGQFAEEERDAIQDPFQHYISEGVAQSLSPNSRFDEKFYTAFYDDVRLAISTGQVRCGFHHYLAAGKAETRIGRFEQADALEARFYGITQKVGVRRTEDLAQKLRPMVGEFVSKNERRMTVVLPDLNPDLFFGGYKSLVEFITCLVERGNKVRIIKSESAHDGKDYFMYHYKGHRLGNAFEDIEVLGAHARVPTSAQDVYMSYSTWDAYVARSLTQTSGGEKFLMFAQEYEPIFHSQNSHRFLCENAYKFNHYPIFNSGLLLDYFRDNRIGIFEENPDNPEFSVFEHVLAPPAKPVPSTTEKEELSLFVYARPESHAERNLFEVVILALREALLRRPPEKKWNFFGLGALGADTQIGLGPNHVLDIRSRLPYEVYSERMSSVDLAISLMYAPHPSVVPFELSQNGAFVVTNTYSNRSAEKLRGMSPNIVPVAMDLDAIVDGIVETMARVERGEQGQRVMLDARHDTWSGAFSHVFTELEAKGFL